jgi:predicted NBD/HSP70 family sugar kinase
VGAGIGFGLVVDGRVVTGHNGRAGQLDHLLVDTTGPTCGLGHHGCASAYLPSACIVQAIATAGEGGTDLDYDGAVARARAGDPIALRAFGDAARALGIIIGTVLNGLDPEKIVLTGDGLALMELQGETVMQTIESTRVPSALPVPLDVQPFEFTEWARAGAVLAIRSLLRF